MRFSDLCSSHACISSLLWEEIARRERGADGGRREENLVLVQTKTVPVCRTVMAYIRYVFVVLADLWRKSHVGKTSSPSSIPSPVYSLLPSIFLSLSLSLSLSISISFSFTSSLRIPAMFDSFYRGPSTYLSLTSHEKYIRDSSRSLFSLSSVRLLAFSQPFQWWFSRVLDEKSRDRLMVVVRSLSSFSLFLLL